MTGYAPQEKLRPPYPATYHPQCCPQLVPLVCGKLSHIREAMPVHAHGAAAEFSRTNPSIMTAEAFNLGLTPHFWRT
ncbi:MAG TPA: hypothetical protein VFC87_06790 [Perlabentimonas sp.]|nr:hypothetical protein [Perlabentimonas sp.]